MRLAPIGAVLAVLVFGLLGVQGTRGATTTFTALADTRINRLAPTTNYAGVSSLRADVNDYDSLLRFTVSGLAGPVQSARLRVYVTEGSAATTTVSLTGGSWTETSVTWKTAPPKGVTAGTLPPAKPGVWVEADVSRAVAGNGALSFRLSMSSSDGLTIGSRRSANKPQLVINTGPPTNTPSPTGLVTPAAATPSPATPTLAVAPTPVVAATPSVTPTPSLTPTPVPTLTTTPTTTPSNGIGSASLSLPIRAAFYYPWFRESWDQVGYQPFTRFTPSLGFYSSSDASVVQSHVAAMQDAGIQAGIASWWGQGSQTDLRVPALLANAGTFRWTLYHEAEGTGDPTVTQIQSDLAYILSRYAANPAYLRVAGKPVIFVYGNGSESCATMDRWATANAGRFYLMMKVFAGWQTCASQPDSWHQYGPAFAVQRFAGYSFNISPGFWRVDEPAPRLARDLGRWQQNVADMVASRDPWQLITSFNEFGEGTVVEATQEFGTAYLDVLAGRPITATPSPTPSDSPTPSPTPSDSPTPSLTPSDSPTPSPTPSDTPTPTP